MDKRRNIICIDLKSFFASVECVHRGLDPFKVPLVVADISRGNGAMTLAATPYLRSLGVKSRSRVFTLPKNINIIYAKPRMSLYSKASNEVISIYKEFFSEEDIHVYSIDEVFIDATDYLKYYNMTDYELAKLVMKTIKDRLNLTTTCGIGPNILLAKVALDIEAKSAKDFIAKWDYSDIETKLWCITPLSELWGIGSRIEKSLNNLGIKKIGDINNYSRSFYIKRFGNVAGNEIWCKANGIDFSTVKEKNKQPRDKSISLSQILKRDYLPEEAIVILKEMTDMLCKQLRDLNKVTKRVFVAVNYSRDINKYFKDTITLSEETDDPNEIFSTVKYIYESHIEELPVRKVAIAFYNLYKKSAVQLNLFEQTDLKSSNYNKIIDQISQKYGPTTILRASSLLKCSTIKERERFKNMIDD